MLNLEVEATHLRHESGLLSDLKKMGLEDKILISQSECGPGSELLW